MVGARWRKGWSWGASWRVTGVAGRLPGGGSINFAAVKYIVFLDLVLGMWGWPLETCGCSR